MKPLELGNLVDVRAEREPEDAVRMPAQRTRARCQTDANWARGEVGHVRAGGRLGSRLCPDGPAASVLLLVLGASVTLLEEERR